MKKILVFVSTTDGKITKWWNPRVRIWSSEEDQKYFSKLWNESQLVVMGSNTYNAETILPSSQRIVVIMTRRPEDYMQNEVSGCIEFTKESPSDLVKRFEERGYNVMLVVGGPHVATSFFREGMIDEIWLTLEPLVFGSGGNFVVDEKLDIHLKLLSSEIINQQGTLILKYGVLKNST